MTSETPRIWIQRKHKCWFCRRIPDISQEKPAAMIHVDAMLWQNFSSNLDQFLPRLNSGAKCIYSIVLYILVPINFVVWVAPTILRSVYFDEEDNEIPWYIRNGTIGIVFLILLSVIGFAGHWYVVTRNKPLDEEIRKVCETFEPQFRMKGFSIKYETEDTALNAFNQFPTRAIAFPPVPVAEEGQQSDDLIDRQAWGL